MEEDILDKYGHRPEVTNDHNNDKLSEQLKLEMAHDDGLDLAVGVYHAYAGVVHVGILLKQECMLHGGTLNLS